MSGSAQILVVDDEAAVRESLRRALALEGYEVELAADGAEALYRLDTGAVHPDAIVLDVLMPGIDGLETCARIKSDSATADIPVLLLTGADTPDLSERAKAVWASSVLRKPCPADQLRTAILAATGNFSSIGQLH